MLNSQTQFTASGEIAESSLPENRNNNTAAARANTAKPRVPDNSQAARAAELQKAAQIKRAAAIQKVVEQKMKQSTQGSFGK